ncbi:NUDIX hydrolase domain-like protein [Pisolithus albus]|nr:NUDIX hydrolase domain-like protein [Pisolithus albus]
MATHSGSVNLTFLDLVNACDNFRLPENHRADVPSSSLTQDTLVPWTLSQSLDSPVVGLLKPEIIDLLREEGDKFWIIPDPATVPRSTYRVSFHPSIDTPAKRTDRLDISGHHRAKKWRNEMYPVYRNPFGVHRAHDLKAGDDSDDGNYAFEMERSACALFGVITYGVHMTIYQQAHGSEMQIWVPTRSRTKQTWPGYLDNSVAGGIPSGMSVFESLVKEAAEEASIDQEITSKYAKCAGSISYYRQTSAGWLQPEIEYIPDDGDTTLFQPKPADGEVESFNLLPLHVVISKMKQGLFKANCAVVLIDFLIRHGYLTPDNDPDFMEIITRIHGRFHYERW